MRAHRWAAQHARLATLLRVMLAIWIVASTSLASAPTAHAASFTRVRTLGGQLPSSSVVDADGNTYILGQFSGTITLDPDAGATTLTAAGLLDLVIVKLNSAGSLVWAEQVGAPTWTVSTTGLALHPDGFLYLTGSFNGTVDFNPGGGTNALTPKGAQDGFLLILTTDNTYSAVYQFGGTGASVTPAGVAVDQERNAYLTGFFFGTADFDPTINTKNLTSLNTTADIFSLRLDFTGGVTWADLFSGPSPVDFGFAIVTDNLGNAIVAGQFAQSVDFDPTGGVDSRSAAGGLDAFVLKLDGGGRVLWVDTYGGLGDDLFGGLAVDRAGNVYVSGGFQSATDFDPRSGQHVVTPRQSGSNEAYLLKLDSGGAFKWVATMDGAGTSLGGGIVVDDDGNIYQVGTFSGTVDFDPGPGLANRTAAGTGGSILKLDSGGTFVGVDLLLGNAGSLITPFYVKLDPLGQIVVTGLYQGLADFDPGPGVANRSAGGFNGFTLTLSQVAPPVNGLPNAQATVRDTPLVLSSTTGNALSVTDADAGSSPLRITLTATSGTVTLKGGSDLTFSAGDGTADQTMTFAGTLSAINAALDGLTFTPSAGFTGNASLQITAFDQTGPASTQTDADTLVISVSPPSQRPGGPPTAANDAYALIAQTTLSVPAPGLLANDTSPASAPLTASQVQAPSHGAVILKPDGSFSYTPSADFYSTDIFTYRVSDGVAQSNVATVTITVAPTQCAPRPKVQATLVPGGGKLSVHVEATPLSTGQANDLRELRFETLQNAKVTLNSQAVTSSQTVTLPANTSAIDFTVERATPGQATTVPFTVRDGCGDWQTFVGGGSNAGF